MNEPRELLTTGQAALELGTLEWRIVELFRRGLLPEPQRLGRSRIIRRADLPRIEKALRDAGYLEPAAPAAGPT